MLTPVALLLPTALGYIVVSLLLRSSDEAPAGPLERLSLGYPLGMGLLTMQMFLLGLLRVPLTLASITPVIVIEIVALAVLARRSGVVLFPQPSLGIIDEVRDPSTPLWKKAALFLLPVWVCTKLGSVLYEAALRPIFAWDVWVNWSVGAKSFFFSRSLLLDAPGADFFGAGAVSRIISYPLHNPLMQVWLALWTGGFDESLVKLWSPLMLASAAGCLYVFARGGMGRTASLALVAVFLGAPLLSYHSIEVYSDLLVGTNLFCALLSFVRVMQGRRAYLPLVGAFAAIALFSKNEAPGFVLPLMLSAGVWLWTERERQPLGSALVRLLAPLALVLPWFLFKFAHSLSLTQDRHALEPAYQAGVADYIAGQLLTLQNFNIVLVALPLLLVINGRPSKALLHALFPPAFFTLFFVVLYMLIDYYHSTLLMGTIFYRNVLTYYPSLALVTAMVLGELLAKNEAPAPDLAARKTKRRR